MKLLYLISTFIAMTSCSEKSKQARPMASFSKSSGMVNCQLQGNDSYTFDVWSVSDRGKATKISEVYLIAKDADHANLTISISNGLVVTGDKVHDLRSEVSSTKFQEHPFASTGDKSLLPGALLWSAYTSDVTYKTTKDVPSSADSIDEVKDLSIKHNASSVAITMQ